jgi:hypothetical protein
MALVRRQAIKNEVIALIKKYDGKDGDIKNIDFIIDRYLYYLIEAIKRGYTIPIAKKFNISMKYIAIKDVKECLMRFMNFTVGLFGYHFIVSIDSKFMKDNKYSFSGDIDLNNSITSDICVDDLYKLVK